MSDTFEHVLVTIRSEWRDWLVAHHRQRQSIWLVTYKKGFGPKVSYDEIVGEALCFGWVDSRPAKLDDTRSMLMLSPRKRSSSWSKANKQRVDKLQMSGLMMPAGQAIVEDAQKSGAWDRLNEVEAGVVPADLAEALESIENSKVMWGTMPTSSQRGILEWINAAKRPETRRARIGETARLAALGIKANFPAGRNRIPLKS